MLRQAVFLTFCCFSFIVAQTIAITGTVKDKESGSPVSGAVVTLAQRASLKDTTGSDGKFSLSTASPVRMDVSGMREPATRMTIRNGSLVLRADNPGKAEIAILNVAGRQVFSIDRAVGTDAVAFSPRLPDGFYVASIQAPGIDAKLSFLSCNGSLQSCRAVDGRHAVSLQKRAADAAAIDTLLISAVGYAAASLPLTGYVLDTTLLLDAVTGKPNVILVMLDDVGYGNFGCTGDKVVKTPHIDKFHDESVRFTDFHVGPTCSPTRAALLTGHYSNGVGVWHTILQRDLPRLDEWFLPQAMKSGGYTTGMFGKWHLGDNAGYVPEDRGFDLAIRHGFGGITQTGDYWGNNYGINGHDDSYYVNGIAQKFPGYCTTVWFQQAIKWMKQNKDKPFFAFISMNIAHAPLNPPPGAYRAMYSGKVPKGRATHYAMLTHMDDMFDTLRTFLKAEGLEENTILMFTTDNGQSGGINAHNAGMRGHKSSPYEGGHRVPLFVRWPAAGVGGADGTGGKDINDLVAHVDLFPTFLDICDIPAAGHTFDGVSLGPLMQGKVDSLGDRILVVDNQRLADLKKYRQFSVMKDKWRLVGDGTKRELFNIANDKGQRKNVIGSNAAIANELEAAYEEWWTKVSAKKDEESSIPIGDRPTHVNAGDMRVTSKGSAHMQFHIKDGVAVRGYWEVVVEKAGKYRFDLRRWPIETDGEIRGKVDGGKALSITKATIKIAGMTEEKAVADGEKYARFELDLPQGKTHLEAFFGGGVNVQAYFVYIEPVE